MTHKWSLPQQLHNNQDSHISMYFMRKIRFLKFCWEIKVFHNFCPICGAARGIQHTGSQIKATPSLQPPPQPQLCVWGVVVLHAQCPDDGGCVGVRPANTPNQPQCGRPLMAAFMLPMSLWYLEIVRSTGPQVTWLHDVLREMHGEVAPVHASYEQITYLQALCTGLKAPRIRQ